MLRLHTDCPELVDRVRGQLSDLPVRVTTGLSDVGPIGDARNHTVVIEHSQKDRELVIQSTIAAPARRRVPDGARDCASQSLELVALMIRAELQAELDARRDAASVVLPVAPRPPAPRPPAPSRRLDIALLAGARLARVLPREVFGGPSLALELTNTRWLVGLAGELALPRDIERPEARIRVLPASVELRAGAFVWRRARVALSTQLALGLSVLARQTRAVDAVLTASDPARSVRAHVGALVALDVRLATALALRLSGGLRLAPGSGDFVIDDTDGARTLARGTAFVPWLALELRVSRVLP